LTTERDGRGGPESAARTDLVADLTRWLIDTRSEAASASRARERWLRQQAEEEARFAGILLDLAERDRPLVVQLAHDRRHRGHVRAVAEDFLALRTLEGTDVLLRYAGIVAARPEGPDVLLDGDRPCALDMRFAEAVVAICAERPRVLVVTLDGSRSSGELRAAGRDVLALRLDGRDRATSYVPLAAVAEVSLTR